MKKHSKITIKITEHSYKNGFFLKNGRFALILNGLIINKGYFAI